jgi:hypothetical protein
MGRSIHVETSAFHSSAAFLGVQNHWPTSRAASVPASCAQIKAMAPLGVIPAKVSESDRAIVTAGFANEVEAVNQ